MNWKVFAFFILTIAASAMYAFANFKESFQGKSIIIAVLISIGFAACEYSLKIPGFFLARDSLSPIFIQVFWMVMTFIMVIIFQRFYIKEKVHIHTLIIGGVIVILLAIEAFFVQKKLFPALI